MQDDFCEKRKVRIKFSSIDFRGICLSIIAITVLESFYQIADHNMNFVIGRVFGYVAFENYNLFLSSIIMFLLPQLGILLIWGNYFDENIVENSDIIFTRTRIAARIVWKYILELHIGVTIMTAALEISICTVYWLKGYQADDLYRLLADLLVYIAYMNLLAVIVNVLSLVIKIMSSILATLSLQLVALQCIYMMQNSPSLKEIYYALPTSAVLMYWNQSISCQVKSIWIAYICIIILLVEIMGCMAIKKKEFL